MLRSELDGRSYFAAGVPWFATLFGRDSLIARRRRSPSSPDVAADTLRLLGDLLGREHDDERDEEPGKVLHELRVGEPAALGETPFARYYGSADATPLWLCAAVADHADWSGSLDLFRELRPQVDAALDWIDRPRRPRRRRSRRVPAPLAARPRRTRAGRTRRDGVPDRRRASRSGRPIALVEVQGYVVRALRGIARLFELDGEASRAGRCGARAADGRGGAGPLLARRTPAATRSAWTAPSGPAPGSPRTRGTCSGPARCRPSGRGRCATC